MSEIKYYSIVALQCGKLLSSAVTHDEQLAKSIVEDFERLQNDIRKAQQNINSQLVDIWSDHNYEYHQHPKTMPWYNRYLELMHGVNNADDDAEFERLDELYAKCLIDWDTEHIAWRQELELKEKQTIEQSFAFIDNHHLRSLIVDCDDIVTNVSYYETKLLSNEK